MKLLGSPTSDSNSYTPSVDDPKWRVDIYGQNITDEQNIMHIGEATAPLGFNKSIWAREQATYGVRNIVMEK